MATRNNKKIAVVTPLLPPVPTTETSVVEPVVQTNPQVSATDETLIVAREALASAQAKHVEAQAALAKASAALGQGDDSAKEMAGKAHAAALTDAKNAEAQEQEAARVLGRLAAEEELKMLAGAWKEANDEEKSHLIALGKLCSGWIGMATKVYLRKDAIGMLEDALLTALRQRVDWRRYVRIYHASELYGPNFVALPIHGQKVLAQFVAYDSKADKWGLNQHADKARKLYDRAVKENLKGSEIQANANVIAGKKKTETTKDETSPAGETPSATSEGSAPAALPSAANEASALIARLLLSHQEAGTILFNLGQVTELKPELLEELFHGMVAAGRSADFVVLFQKMGAIVRKHQEGQKKVA